MRKLFAALWATLIFSFAAVGSAADSGAGQSVSPDDPTGFVELAEAVPDVILVSDDVMAQGYRLKVYDAYRPQMAVSHFVRWAEDLEDTRMKPYFYPNETKDVLFEKGYIAAKSGHSRGSTIDLTLFDMATGKEVDMGGTFDYFGLESHPDWCGNPDTRKYEGKAQGGITETQFRNRMILRAAMLRHGFKPLVEEWWHFTLEDEPYPDTYFTFPVQRLGA